MRLLQDFGIADRDRELNRKLVELERNASDAIDEVARGTVRAPNQKAIITVTGKMARPGELVSVRGVLELLLAQPTGADEGRELIVIVTTAANCTLRPVGGAFVNGASTKVYGSVGRYSLVVKDGAYWGPP